MVLPEAADARGRGGVSGRITLALGERMIDRTSGMRNSE
jgi:hypothetical protein